MDEVAELAPVWRALSSPIRRRMLDLLRGGARSTGDLVAEFPTLSRFAVMQHLGVLEEAGLLLVRREGTKRFNYLNPIPLQEIYERWVSAHASLVSEAALELKRYVERAEGGREVSELQADKFEKIELEFRLAAPPERVFRAMTVEVDRWWPFRFRKEGRIVVEPFVGGRCYEEWGEGRGAMHGLITYWDPPVQFQMRGNGTMSDSYTYTQCDTLEAEGEGCIYRKSLVLWGAVPEQVVGMYREGNRVVFEEHLKAYLATGKGQVASVSLEG